MKYNCVHCNYSTDDHGNWAKHKKSIKHTKTTHNNPSLILNDPAKIPYDPECVVIKKELVGQKEYECVYCNQKYKQSCHLSRHSKSCKEREIKHKLLENQFEKYKREKNLEIKNKKEALKLKNEVDILREKLKSVEEQKEQYKEHIETLKNENKFQKQLIESAGEMIKKSMNTMSYLLLNYNNAPRLQSLPDYSIITKDTETLIKNLIHYNKHGTFEKYIGDFIIKQYKKEDPKLQCLWSSDIERLNYFVRELINCKENNEHINKNNKEGNELSWTIDKRGLKVKKSIIEPLLDYIIIIGNKYLQEKNLTIDGLDSRCAEKLVNDM